MTRRTDSYLGPVKVGADTEEAGHLCVIQFGKTRLDLALFLDHVKSNLKIVESGLRPTSYDVTTQF